METMAAAAAETANAVSSIFSSFLDYLKDVFPHATRQWLRNSLFVGSATFLNMLLAFLALYFWSVNRQTHFKKTRGTDVAHRLSKEGEGYDGSISDSEEGNETDRRKTSPLVKHKDSSVRRRETLSCITALDIEVDDDHEEMQGVRERAQRDHPLLKKEGATPSRRNLVAVIDKIKVFSYLGEEAQWICMQHAEYVDVPIGEFLFNRGEFDGSLYAVLTGSVKCRFHNHVIDEELGAGNNDDECPYESEDGKRLLSFLSSPGDVVTPVLAMLEGLVRERKLLSNPKQSQPRPSDIVNDISVVATSENTRLMRVPPRCFVAVLDKFPVEVAKIAQTFLARMQRVTVQTVVKSMGLHSELMSLTVGEKLDGPEAAAKRSLSSTWFHLSSAFAMTDDIKSLEKLDPLKNDAALAAAAALGVPIDHEESLHVIQEQSSFVSLSPGETLVETGGRRDSIFLLLDGRMEIGAMVSLGSSPPSYHRYFEVHPGALIGRLRCFTGEVSMFTERCCDGDLGAILLKIPKKLFESLLVTHPEALTQCLENILGIISPVVRLIDWNSTWLYVQASETIVRRGDRCDSLFVVLNGRLRASYKSRPSSGAHRQRFEEYGRGRLIGEIGGLTGSAWPCDVYAIRNSEVCKLPVVVVLALLQSHPNAGLHFARSIALQVQAKAMERIQNENALLGPFPNVATGLARTHSRRAAGSILPSYGLALATIAVVPLVPNVDVSAFCSTLVSSLRQIAPTKHMTKAIAREHLGETQYNFRNAMHEIKMTRLLGDMEENNRMVVYEADFKYTWWTRQCVQQSDCILLVVNADEAPEERRVEKCLAWVYESMHVRIELVVVRGRSTSFDNGESDWSDIEDEVNVSDQLNDWSEERKFIAGHHRIRTPFRHHILDFHRMCRRITGLSVGLVLGGGGARGLAHLGVIRALMEAGVAVDMVGGTSQGAYIGAIYALYPDDFGILMEKSREFASTMSSVKEKILDLTFPLTSIFSGRRFNRGIKRTFGDTRIQDTILNFFCTSVDIQKRQQMIHQKGMLWRYVRASMSLAGYLPPVCEEGSMLVDGGYLNSLPADVMRYTMGAHTIIAVDVAAETERDYYNYGTYLSGWWLLWNSLNPFAVTVKVPSMTDISDALRWVSSDQHRRNVTSAADLHLRPPINDYGTLEFDKFDEIVEVGYHFAKPLVDDWVRRNPKLVTASKK